MIEEFIEHTCIYEGCGITWYHSTGFNEQRKKDHKIFYCPNGHSQYYPQKTTEDILKEQIHKLERNKIQLEEERDQYKKCVEHKKHQINGLRGYIKRKIK
jgi:hypothetical protein